jgi:hypothetical protein
MIRIAILDDYQNAPLDGRLVADRRARRPSIWKPRAERDIVVVHTGYDARSTIEMTWALILASARQVALER